MNKLAAASRADLLRCMKEFGSLEPEVAALLGYEGETTKPASRKDGLPTAQSSQRGVCEMKFTGKANLTVDYPTPQRPRLKFLVPVESEKLVVERHQRPPGNPITDAEIAVDWSKTGPPLRPLTSWARLAPFLRQRLGTQLPGSRLDERRLMRLAGTGLPVAVLPRLPRSAWASQAVILWDHTPEMFPFTQDVRWLIHRLKRERGAHGLDVRIIDRLPDRRHIARLPAGVPVLALSAMGQFQGADTTIAVWEALAHRLAYLGQPLHALNPAPRQRWDHALAHACPTGVWDRRPRLPRLGGLRALKAHAVEALSAPTELLLDLLSPATRIEAPLLRAARLSLGSHASAATEWEAWHHTQCWQSMDCFGLKAEAFESRLQQRAQANPEHAREFAALIKRHQVNLSSLIALESDLRACLTGAPDENALRAAHELLTRVIDRLRQLAAKSGSAEVKRSGVASWFIGMVDRLGRDLRAHAFLSDTVATGLALAHTCMETRHVVLPKGVDGEVFKATKTEAAIALPEPIVCRIDLKGYENHAEWQLVPDSIAPELGAFTLATLNVGRRPVQVTFHSGAGQQHSLQFASPRSKVALPALHEFVPVTVESDMHRMRFDAIERPRWAERVWHRDTGLYASFNESGEQRFLAWRKANEAQLVLYGSDWRVFDSGPGKVAHGGWIFTNPPKWAERAWVDQYGLAAQFHIREVPFVLRWIPPGRFLMGSPEDEPGRREAEGPQHDVTISQGYWLAETPVTQAQWRAVVTTAYNIPVGGGPHREGRLKQRPSHFEGPASLPVESVTWHQSRDFCRLLEALLPDGPGFHLPSEAQWEYACRAGTDSALYTGAITIKGENHAPELDAIAWYGGNSGLDLEVGNPESSKDWPSKQFDHQQAGTHRVKLKQANAWGLYDMQGNVWEWCADAWDEKAYAKRADGAVDPRLDLADDSATRVMRGGSWDGRARGCRSACRFRGGPGDVWHYQGLRLAAGQKGLQVERQDDVPVIEQIAEVLKADSYLGQIECILLASWFLTLSGVIRFQNRQISAFVHHHGREISNVVSALEVCHSRRLVNIAPPDESEHSRKFELTKEGLKKARETLEHSLRRLAETK